jgi:NADPH-dependent 2,4-dienoyl-CoA reductase/sulfur reductase-like enzyme
MRLVVIGGNAAGMSAAARARRVDRSLDITVLEKSAHVSWGSCGLPYFVEGQVRALDALVVHPPEYFRAERNIDVRTGADVASIQHSRRQVALAGGERVAYDRLVIATGARAATIPGEGTFTLATMQDAERLRSCLKSGRARRTAIVGAGYLGLELTGTLRAHGAEVTVFEATGEVLGRGDPALTDLVRAHLERCRVDLRLGTRVHDAGETGCDTVVLAAGFKPNNELAADAGIEPGPSGAIRTNDRMETNLSGVFAAGDCAETAHLLTGRPVYLPLGTTANKTGRVAGANAAGRRERFPGIAGTIIVRVCGLGVAVTGFSESQARREGFDPIAATIRAPGKAKYFLGTEAAVQLVADRSTGRILGGWVAGEEGVAGRINVIATALTSRMRLDDFESLDLAYTPPYATVWDPLLIAAQNLRKHGSMEGRL